jgi:hypothetical protein
LRKIIDNVKFLAEPVFHKVLQDETKTATLCDVTIFAPAAQKSLPNTISVVQLVSSGAAGKGGNSHGESWQKKLVFMYLPKRLDEHLIGRDIIGVGLTKSHLSIGKLSTLEKYMQ